MRNKSILLFALLLIAAVYAAQPVSTPPKLVFSEAEFSIAPYESVLADTNIVPVIMAQPASNGFASNVNVMIQPFAGPMSEFISVSDAQFKKANITIISEKTPQPNEWITEYKDSSNGRNLHFYARALSANNHVYLATGTCLEQNWATDAPKIKNCVDSLTPLIKASSSASSPSK